MPPDEDSFDATLLALIQPVRGFCERMLGDRQEAEDATQQAFLQALRAWTDFKGRSSRKTWVFAIAANVCARVLERRHIRREDAFDGNPEQPAGGPEPGARLEHEERRASVQSALQALSPAHRIVLVLFCIDELSHAEIAELLGCPEGTVWSRLHHARKAFENRLREQGFDYTREVLP